MPILRSLVLILTLFHLTVALCDRQVAPPSLSASDRASIIENLIKKLEANYVYPEVAKKMASALRARQASNAYAGIGSGPQFAETVTKDLIGISHDKHIGLEYSTDPNPYDSEKPPDPEVVRKFREMGRRANFEYKKVERLEGSIGLLEVDGFYPGEWAGDTVSAAMSFLSNSDAVILDLRHNHGGFGNGPGLLCSYFFDEETRLADSYNRITNVTQEISTYPLASRAKLSKQGLYILTSRDTFSAAEWVAYTLQALKRATIVGETTGGGAHGTTMFSVGAHFSASIPFSRGINPVTKKDWEGVGVKPDVAVPADEALLTAHLMALRASFRAHAGDKAIAEGLSLVITKKEAELESLRESKKGPRSGG